MLVAALVAIILIAIFVNVTNYYYPKNLGVLTQNELSLDSFARACGFDQAEQQIACKGPALNKVLEERAKNPQFKTFIDTKANISFEYPSSVALVGKEVTSKALLYMIYPQMPATLYSDFWKGVQIFVEPCTVNCSKTVEAHIKSKYGFAKGSKIEVASSTTNIAGRDWSISKLYNSFGKVTTVYSSQNNKNLILVGTDTEFMSANISTAFKKVLETLTF